jgi:HAD superfamily hydrolase (TIGR01509 family)
MFSAIIFDFDGTLVNSLDEHIRSWKKAFDELGVELLEKEIRRKFGKPSTTILSEVLPLRLHGKIGELTKRKQQYFMEQSTSLRLYPGVEKVLEKLKERGMPMAVATSMNRKGLHSALQALGIEKYFDVVITVEDVTRGKPAPEMLLGQEIKKCLMVGDSLFDVLAAERAGMSVVVVANNPYQIEQIREKGVRVVEKIAEILHFL